MRDAIAAGIYNDLGSGSNIDICVISKSKLDFLRPYDVANKKGDRYGRYKCEKGTTAVLTENVALLEFEVVDETVQTMDTSWNTHQPFWVLGKQHHLVQQLSSTQWNTQLMIQNKGGSDYSPWLWCCLVFISFAVFSLRRLLRVWGWCRTELTCLFSAAGCDHKLDLPEIVCSSMWKGNGHHTGIGAEKPSSTISILLLHSSDRLPKGKTILHNPNLTN